MSEPTEKPMTTVDQIRENMLKLVLGNDPNVPADLQNEARTKALANCAVLLCERTLDLWGATSSAIKRLTKDSHEILVRLDKLETDMQESPLPEAPEAPPESASAETAAVPEVLTGESAPPAAPPWNGLVPPMPPGVTVTVKP